MSTTQKKYKDEDWLRTEYVEKRKSSCDIADELGVGDSTILEWLDRHNIKTREPAETYTGGNTKKLRDKKWLEEKYNVENKNIVEIAEELDCGSTTVSNWINKHGIEKEREIHKLRNENWLIEQYVKKEKTSTEISNEINCSSNVVVAWLRRHDIKVRNGVEDYVQGDVSKLRDSEWLYQEYIEKEKSTTDIANELNISSNSVTKWLNKHGIKTRNRSEQSLNSETLDHLQDKEWLEEKYVEENLTTVEISNKINCSDSTVRDWLRKHDIEVGTSYDYRQSVEDVPDHIDHKIRSSWELEVAEMLIDNDVDYEYESMEIEYGDSTYIPDFITDDYIIEVKGWVRGNDEGKKATTTMEKIDDKEYVVVGSALPCDIHIDWENNSELVELFT